MCCMYLYGYYIHHLLMIHYLSCVIPPEFKNISIGCSAEQFKLTNLPWWLISYDILWLDADGRKLKSCKNILVSKLAHVHGTSTRGNDKKHSRASLCAYLPAPFLAAGFCVLLLHGTLSARTCLHVHEIP